MDLTVLWNAEGAAVVFGGTALATMLRSGGGELRAALVSIATLGRSPFDYSAARAQIAGQVEEIRHDGILCAGPNSSSDEEIADATAALIRHRSIGAALATHEDYKSARMDQRIKALRVLEQASELAPIAGLAGTLLALAQLPADGLARSGMMGVVAMAVVSTFYGLLLAHLMIQPLARWVERRADAEEAERQHLIDWLAAQVGPYCPPVRRIERISA
ncbi:MotA/TolQ/ExbB proton channel family protein [Allopontixanthobacter sediminis]|uniref:Chemotaxis protein MotA n=1 Tax=Allopontixanthobacter sediminis TaxID=1689985 RepID=A0A845B686_9SPHN|nr:MotA/TolQ/ExbB proton channel family protein [Allopontixanthobacter sediminis]MXP45666.1 chemotaxis protein MotA [Allopontixanthobacter sediminis]